MISRYFVKKTKTKKTELIICSLFKTGFHDEFVRKSNCFTREFKFHLKEVILNEKNISPSLFQMIFIKCNLQKATLILKK